MSMLRFRPILKTRISFPGIIRNMEAQSSQQKQGAGSLDQFLDLSYQPQGHVQTLPDGVQFYVKGRRDCGKGIMIISDLFGWNTGRTRNLADYMAESGYFVVVPRLLAPTASTMLFAEELKLMIAWPNFFDFSRIGEYFKSLAYDTTLKPKILSVTNYMKSNGIEKISILSYSWGGWVAAHVLSDPELFHHFTCAAIAHPSIEYEDRFFGGNTAEFMTKIQKPILFIPTKGDPDEYRRGGAFYEPLKHRLEASEVLDMPHLDHGFLPRGNIQRKEDHEGICNTMSGVMSFFEKCSK